MCLCQRSTDSTRNDDLDISSRSKGAKYILFAAEDIVFLGSDQ